MSKIAPCIWFDGNAEEAARFYASLVPGSRVLTVGRYGDGMPMPAGTVLLVEFELGGRRFQALNGGPRFTPNPSISFFVRCGDATAARRLHDALAEGGHSLMPFGAYPWSPAYGWVADRYGVSWQVITDAPSRGADTVVPCLMFADAQHGRAREAIERLVELFPGSRVESIETYGAGEGPAGTMKHGRFVLAGEEFVAMDSHLAHGFTFDEGVSLSVSCADQAEVDRLWDALTDGGSPSMCGWATDRFGLSWQVVPEALVRLQSTGDAVAQGRMFRAMLTMRRLDVAALERAYAGDGMGA